MQPRATYRLQLQTNGGFATAASIAPYLSELGISHLYTSPQFAATPGSTHGYDVVDPTRIDPSLGAPADHERMIQAAEANGLELLVDIVPNHMAADPARNRLWRNVLQSGRASPYAHVFDIDWRLPQPRLRGKVLLPVLGAPGYELAASGEIRLLFAERGFELRYQDSSFPLSAESQAALLEETARDESLGGEAALIRHLAHELWHLEAQPPTRGDRILRSSALSSLEHMTLAAFRRNALVRQAISRTIEQVNGNPAWLKRLLVRQHYLLEDWRMSAEAIGYRRFFDVSGLVGIRVEEPEAYLYVHRLVERWFQEGAVSGIRVDHPDGLRDPRAYLSHLAARCPGAWLLVEKILSANERLPADWPVAGTTGYDFLNLVEGLFVDPAGQRQLTELYAGLTGEGRSYEQVLAESKALVLEKLLGADLNRLTRLFQGVCRRSRRCMDRSSEDLRRALLQTAAWFPVYRSYVDERGASPEDRSYVLAAVSAAKEQPGMDAPLLDFLASVLLLDVCSEPARDLSARFQQLTAPAMAKGGEDTAFYRYNRFVALNEVGGDPGLFGRTVADFHAWSAWVQHHHPSTLLATSTHDTKRGEDLRARLSVLSEAPEMWGETVTSWMKDHASLWPPGLEDRNLAYLLYQTLVGCWPVDSDRFKAYAMKAAREAKQSTSWLEPGGEFEAGLEQFVGALLNRPAFRADLERLVLTCAFAARSNSLAQTLLKLTAPGVPDVYNGAELWDFSLVDPDNRRPVDFRLRNELLARLAVDGPSAIPPGDPLGASKMWLIRTALHLRRRRPAAFGPAGRYEPLLVAGSRSEHVVAYVRGGQVVAVAPRLVFGWTGPAADWWGETSICLPDGRWLNLLSGDVFEGGRVALARLVHAFPAALLESERPAGPD